MYGYVYLTTNLINNKKYVGMHKSETFDPNYKGSDKIIRRACEKYGWDNFETVILEECNSFDELKSSEMFWIKRLNAVNDPDYYNISDGGHEGAFKSNGVSIRQGVIASPEARKHLSEAHIGKSWTEAQRKAHEGKFVGDKNPFYGKDFSPETKKLLSKIRAGRVWINNGISETTIKPDQLDKYLSEGYTQGRLKKSIKGWSDAYLKESWNWITKDQVNKRVTNEDLESYLNEGWKKGRYIPPRRATTIENTANEKDIS